MASSIPGKFNIFFSFDTIVIENPRRPPLSFSRQASVQVQHQKTTP
jgi:hypothetical protein